MLSLNFSPFPNLKTGRLLLRQVTFGDENEIFFLRSDENVNRYVDRPKPNSLQDARDHIDKVNNGIANNEAIFWGITLLDNNSIIGTICLWNISKENYTAEVGFDLMPGFQGKGIMQEALVKVLDFGFNSIKFHSIEAVVDPRNSASAKLLEKTGFTKAGHFKEHEFFDGKFIDSVFYTLITSVK